MRPPAFTTASFRLGGRTEALLRAASCVVLGDDGAPLPVGRLATGHAALDGALGGGLPEGRLVELFGAPGSGKTGLALALAAAAQRQGAVAWLDAEGAFEGTRAAAAGLDLDRLVVARPTCGEDALQIAEALLRSRACALLVLDSVAALVPRAELRAPLGEAATGLQARMLSQALRRLVHAALGSGCVGLFLNQTRLALDGPVPELVTAGGSALRFYAALRLEVERAPGGAPSPATVRVVKNRHGREGQVVALTP
ncbi:MAG: AAA family ATPase [Deltaproteobacteria bacterium]|nr:AAA family ATPase [Deltaproteobacteria bacterium]